MSDHLSEVAARRLRAEMGIRRMTQADVASSLGVSIKKVSRLTSGSFGWTLTDVDNVATLFGVDGPDLILSPILTAKQVTA